MVARGDLGVEIGTADVPLLQKRIIARALERGRPVITATQMLESMIHQPEPTRAEASDVANAILDGTSAIMLSGETAVGEFPIEAVEVMNRIACAVEPSLDYRHEIPHADDEPTIGQAMSNAACDIAEALEAKAILVPTFTGRTASAVARLRPRRPIIAVTHQAHSLRHMALEWGVTPLEIAETDDVEDLWDALARRGARERHRRRRRPRRDHRRHGRQHPRLDQRDQGRHRVEFAMKSVSRIPRAVLRASRDPEGPAAPADVEDVRCASPRRKRRGERERATVARAPSKRARRAPAAPPPPVVVLTVMAFLYYRPLSSYLETRSELGARRAQVVALRAEKARLERRLARTTSDAALAREARRIGYVKPGERLFIVKGIAAWQRRHPRR